MAPGQERRLGQGLERPNEGSEGMSGRGATDGRQRAWTTSRRVGRTIKVQER